MQRFLVATHNAGKVRELSAALETAGIHVVFAACRDLADAPCSRTIYNALLATLPDMRELERRLNRSLCHKLPKSLLRKSRILAIDLTLIPYHGQPSVPPQ